MKVLITGGAEGLGRELGALLDPEYLNLSRRTGHDIRRPDVRQQIAETSLQYDVFLNYAHSGDFGQTELLYEVFAVWKSAKKTGWIINFGSYATYSKRDEWRPFAVYKTALDVANRQCCKEIEATGLGFRMCNLRLGRLRAGRNVDINQVCLTASDLTTALRALFSLPAATILPELVLSSVGPAL